MGGFMEEDIVNCNIDTINIPRLDVERKTLPVMCPWRNMIKMFLDWDVERVTRLTHTWNLFGML